MKRALLGLPNIERNGSNFLRALVLMADRLGLDPSYIAAVMSHESGFNPAATNPSGGATGLIQFMPATAKAFGTTTDALRAMSAEQQIVFVERFFRPYVGRMRADVPGDYLMATFMPAFIGKPDDFVLFTSPSTGYVQNRGFDRDDKGKIVVGDVVRDINGIVSQARTRPPVQVETDTPLAESAGSSGSPSPSPQSTSPTVGELASAALAHEADRERDAPPSAGADVAESETT